MTRTNHEAFMKGIIRISMIQLARSIGFTKSKPSAIDILTDLYVRFFELLITTTKNLQQLRAIESGIANDETEMCIQDIQQAIDDLALFRPSNRLDLYDIDATINDEYCSNLQEWVFGPIPDRARDMSKPSLKYVRNKKLEDLQNKLNRVGLGELINTRSYNFSSKTKEEIELEKLLNDELVINTPEDFLQYLVTTTSDDHLKEKLKTTFLADQLYDEFVMPSDGDGDSRAIGSIGEANDNTHGQGQGQNHDDVQPADNNDPGPDSTTSPDYIIQGPSTIPEYLQQHVPYNVHHDIPDLDIAAYLNRQNMANMESHIKHEITFDDHHHHHGSGGHNDNDENDTGFQLGGW